METQENVIKTCKINDEVFKELLEGVKHCVDKSDSRPVLRYIQVAVKEKSVVFTALDGFRAGRTETYGFIPSGISVYFVKERRNARIFKPIAWEEENGND